MQRPLGVVFLALFLTGSVGCGSAIPIPMPVPTSPAAVDSKLAPRLDPPPSEVVHIAGSPGFCGHEDFGQVAVFGGHYDATDGAHYHRWGAPAGELYWVRC